MHDFRDASSLVRAVCLSLEEKERLSKFVFQTSGSRAVSCRKKHGFCIAATSATRYTPVAQVGICHSEIVAKQKARVMQTLGRAVVPQKFHVPKSLPSLPDL